MNPRKLKKSIASLSTLVLTFLLIFSIPSATSAGLSGTPCSRAGKTKIESGRKYICVYKNKTLIWKKGAIYVAPNPVSSSSLAPRGEEVVIENHNVGPLLWREEFDSSPNLNEKFWSARYCGHEASNGGGTCHNDESQYYLPEAIKIDNLGNAVITTKYITSRPSTGTCLGSQCFFTSGRFDTQGKVLFQYGYIEARIKMPAGGGNWPAFWMLGENITELGWPNSGEIDVAEGFGDVKTKTSSAFHYSTTGIGCCANHLYDAASYDVGDDYSADFHTFGVAWLPNQIEFYVDRKLIFRTSSTTIRSTIWPSNAPNFLIINNAVTYGRGFGGAWDGWQSSKMFIDYVRHYKIDGVGKVLFKKTKL